MGLKIYMGLCLSFVWTRLLFVLPWHISIQLSSRNVTWWCVGLVPISWCYGVVTVANSQYNGQLWLICGFPLSFIDLDCLFSVSLSHSFQCSFLRVLKLLPVPQMYVLLHYWHSILCVALHLLFSSVLSLGCTSNWLDFCNAFDKL